MCFVSFGSVNVRAASEENLIEPNLKNWTILEDYKSSTTVLSGSDTGAVQLVSISPAGEQNGFSANVGALYDITSSYKVGDKYTLSFEFLNADKYIGGGAGIISSKAFSDYNGVLYVGLATSDNTGVTAVDGYFVEINGDNYNQYVDSTITYSFEMPSGVVNPCIFIQFMAFIPDSNMNHTCWLAFRNIQFINQTEADEQGFLDGLFEWFEVKFKAIGDSFTDLKDSFVAKINDLKESFQNKIDELKQSFVDLKTDLIEGIKGLFVPDEAFVTSWTKSMEDLASERLGIIWQAGDFLVTLVTTVVDLVVNAPEEISLALPAIDIEVAGMNIHLWDEQKVDFSFLDTNAFFSMFYSLYKVVLNVSFGIPLLHYARKELDNTLHN